MRMLLPGNCTQILHNILTRTRYSGIWVCIFIFGWWFQIDFLFSPRKVGGRVSPILTHIFQRGWKHQLVPKIVVFIMENPIKMDDLGGKTHYLRKHPYTTGNLRVFLHPKISGPERTSWVFQLQPRKRSSCATESRAWYASTWEIRFFNKFAQKMPLFGAIFPHLPGFWGELPSHVIFTNIYHLINGMILQAR